MSKLKLVIFDYDGLMVNSEQVVFSAISKLLKKYGRNLTWDYYVHFIGSSVSYALQHLHQDLKLEIPYEDFARERNLIAEEYLKTKLKLMPGTLKLLNFLRKNKIKTAIATSAYRHYLIYGLKKFEIANFFNTIVSIEDVKRGKPHPDLFLKALKKAGIKKEHSLILEDSPHGIEAAYRAGIESIAIPSEGVPISRYTKASKIFKDLYQAQAFIEKRLSLLSNYQSN